MGVILCGFSINFGRYSMRCSDAWGVWKGDHSLWMLKCAGGVIEGRCR